MNIRFWAIITLAILGLAGPLAPIAAGAEPPPKKEKPAPKSSTAKKNAKGGAAKGNDKAAMGSPDFYPSAARPVGWRGDGSGRFPGATPPLTWSRPETGARKNIVWETKLPCFSWATPIVVGDKIFVLSEPYDLFCIDKNTGKILWLRSYPPFVAVPAEELKAKPAWGEVAKLVEQLDQLDAAYVAKGWSEGLYRQRHDLQKAIDAATVKVDRKYRMPPDQYVESWSGYTPQTPCSDGQNVFVSAGDGVTACYDLDGKRLWQHFESLVEITGEHGAVCSPTLSGDLFLVSGTQFHAYDKKTGVEKFLFEKPTQWGTQSLIPMQVEGMDFVIASGAIYRVADGKLVVPQPTDIGGSNVVVQGSGFIVGGGCLGIWSWAPKGKGELTLTAQIKEEYNRVRMPSANNPTKLKVDPSVSDGFYTASPLYHDGLIYMVSQWGKLVVIDATKTKAAEMVVYETFPSFDLKNGFTRKTPGMGIGASPALAGKNIYMIDSAGTCVVIEPGRTYKELAHNNIDHTMAGGWEQNYWLDKYHEQTEASPIFDGNRIYIRSEQFLYCIGEK